MTREQHRNQYRQCARLALFFVLVSAVVHEIERYFRADFDLGYTFLWIAVLLLAQGNLQHLKSLPPPETRAP